MAFQSRKTAGSQEFAPSIEALTRSNIESILRTEDAARQEKPVLHRIVERAAQFCGTLSFLGLNLFVVVAWILVNASGVKFDPYPYTLLLFAVSIEAILLSILILISQNLSAIESERRHHLDLQINLLNEREMTALLRISTSIATKLGVDAAELTEVQSLSKTTDPTAVMQQIIEAEKSENK